MSNIKVNCFEVDIKNIKEGICIYQKDCGEDPSFIIMSEDTESALTNQEGITNFTGIKNPGYLYNRSYKEIWGIPVGLCNKLPLGEVYIV